MVLPEWFILRIPWRKAGEPHSSADYGFGFRTAISFY